VASKINGSAKDVSSSVSSLLGKIGRVGLNALYLFDRPLDRAKDTLKDMPKMRGNVSSHNDSIY
jgi:hypothetical protein